MFRPIHNYGLKWNEDEYVGTATLASHEALSHDMYLMREFQDDMERFKSHHNVGSFVVDGKALRARLVPVPEQSLTAMKKVLTDIAKRKCLAVLHRFETAIKTLDERPKGLQNYAEYVKALRDIRSAELDMDESRDEAESLYHLLRQYNVRVPSDDQFHLDSLISKGSDLSQRKVIEAHAFINEKREEMVEHLTTLSLKVEEGARELFDQLKRSQHADAILTPEVVLDELQGIAAAMAKLDEKASTLTEYQGLCQLLVPIEYAEVQKAKALLCETQQLWNLVHEWGETRSKWLTSDILKIDVEVMDKKVNEFAKTSLQSTRALPNDVVATKIKSLIDDWKSNMPCIMDLGNKAMRGRHWGRIYAAIGMSTTTTNLMSLEHHKIYEIKELVAEISSTASGEHVLEQSLEKVVKAWANVPLPVMSHRYQKELWILADVADIIAQLEDHCVQVQTMIGSRYVVGIRDKVHVWDHKIKLSMEVVDEWLLVQRAWMYLESIFWAEDIQTQLPNEATKFKAVDKFWKDTMRKVRQSHRNAIDAFQIPGLLLGLQSAHETLDQIQKSLEAYLETKRIGFPRFYFLSDDELLSILSQTRNPAAVNEHICKAFDAINRVTFSKDKKNDIFEMSDLVKETVVFFSPIATTGVLVEKWFMNIEKGMFTTLRALTKLCVEEYPEDGALRKDWLFGPYPSQSVLAVDQIMWTHSAEAALNQIESNSNPNAMVESIEFTKTQLEHSVSLVRLDLTKLQRVLMGALIVLDVHGLAVLNNLVDAKCRSTNDFDWSKQLRYYWASGDEVMSDGKFVTDDCVIRQTIAAFRYSYEYLGNTPRLVVTPLTDKCYMTLTGAMHLNCGGAPAGPAGTGKTETTKDLGKALAVPVIVFNCSEGLDYKIMGRFFSGLAQAGAWACFEEFNHIQVEVLSVIAQHMLTVTQAIRAKKDTFEFSGCEIPLNSRFGVFITLILGYTDRAELPDNLKSLFRPVSMIVPDYALIAEIILYSEGFGNATKLSRKMVSLYTLSSEQLSKQDHYDFGMRAVKSVLVMAGQVKRRYPDLAEDVTLIRALRDSNVPKFLSYDLPVFFGIIADLYPEAEVPYVDYGDLQREIEHQLQLARLQSVPAFVGKIIQLMETQLVRHGVMVVGTTCIGKSTNIRVLSHALTQLRKDNSPDTGHQSTRLFSLNPKSITMTELYGSFNTNTCEWTDGLIAILVREAVSDKSDRKKWVLFDGPVDAIWIENLNTVLDDNKMLCLANRERIKLPQTMTIMFEVADLKVASPATVSRCGMVYLESVQLGWRPLIETWAETFRETYTAYIDKLKEWVLLVCAKALPFLREVCVEAPGIASVNTNLVTSFLRMLTTFISARHGFASDDAEPDKGKMDSVRLYCAFSAVWSLGGNLHESSRRKFQEHLKPVLRGFCPEAAKPNMDLYSVCVSDDAVAFTDIKLIVPDFEFDPRASFFSIFVPTVETTLQRLLVENLMHGGFHVLFSGETGVGKSVGVQHFMNAAGDGFTVASANFSAQTSSANVVDFLENHLEKKRKNLLGAPPGTKTLLFIDDVNMPMLEMYGAQPPIELLRQVIDHRGFYDRKRLFFKTVQDAQFIAACGPPGGGKMEVTPRMLRHFNMFWMTTLPVDTMNRILSSILGGWLRTSSPQLESLAERIVEATVDMFFQIVSDLLPTPTKCHYTFNLRDPAKMLQGILMIDVKSQLKGHGDLTRLWLHESCRQFRDRLTCDEDREWFDATLVDKIDRHLEERWPVDQFSNLTYGDFEDRHEKRYSRVYDPEKLLQMFEESLEEYNAANASRMNLVFFKDAQNHCARAARVLRQPRGSALLVGVGGVGRKSMARMASHMREYACSSIETTRSYSPNDFREDIKGMMMNVARNVGRGHVFLFSDTQLVKDSFLEDINNILNTGEVPNLFASEEQEEIISLTRPLAKAAGKVDARDCIWQHFVQVIRDSLHIVLAFSPVGDGFRARCRQFPSIINCTTIDWYDSWPSDALTSVAERYYRDVPKELDITGILKQLSRVSSAIHVSSSSDAATSFFDRLRRRTYSTPTSYLELIQLFTEFLGSVRGALATKLNRYKVGAQRLEETKLTVDKLKVDLVALQPVIEQGKIDTASLIVHMDQEEASAKETQLSCEADEALAGKAAATANSIKTECQRELDAALPEFFAAIKSIDSLEKKDIQAVKSFTKPPPLVEAVLLAVCLLLGKKETWDEAKELMNDSNFLSMLKDYDKDGLAVNTKLIAKLQRYIRRDDFQPQQVSKVSAAATSLCQWVRSMDGYARVARSIGPKKQKLNGAEASLAEANEKLAVKKAELKVVQDKVASLHMQLSRAKSKVDILEQDAETCKVKLGRAEKLLAGLGNESVRWEKASEVLSKNLTCVVGNSILAAGFVAYAGPYTAEFRADLVKTWLKISLKERLGTDTSWNCAEVLCDPAEIRQWSIASLPSDDLSVENGILVTRSRRWPLMIDPQGQGNRWIKITHKDRIAVIKLSTPHFMRALEMGIREGNPILLENVEERLDPCLEPILLKQVFRVGGQMVLRLGSEDVPYNEAFAFYITTKMRNPHYLPEICVKVTVINFTVTLDGLEDQLVADVVANERPDLAELRADLVVQSAADKAERDRLEQLILLLFSEAGDDLLADDTLIVTLEQSKDIEMSCKGRMASAVASMKEIDTVTETFRPVAARASVIYFVVAGLADIDPMYQYSLQFFVSLFKLRLDKSEKSADVRRRIDIVLSDFTEFIFGKICGGLFEDHKLLFAFLITVQILRHDAHTQFMGKRPITSQEWRYFLLGADAGTSIVANDEVLVGPEWMSRAAWIKLNVLERITVSEGNKDFDGFTARVSGSSKEHHEEDWVSFLEDDLMHERLLPGTWCDRLTAFQQLLVIKSLRENYLQLAVRRFIEAELGDVFTVSPPFDLMARFKDSQKTTPLIFILLSGADPTDTLLKLAREVGYEERLRFISLGQGQGEKAEKLVKLGQALGDWVCLQNCHLAASWMPALERIQETQDPGVIDDGYRLWLTSMPSSIFPVPVLQGGIKITNEPPKGLRANLARTFQEITPEFYESCSKSREFKKLIFCLAFFHAAILERRRFGSIGWNVPYEWMESDFQVSREQVAMYLESQPGVPWVTLKYIIAEANYGGRVTDDKDVRLICALLMRCFNENVLEDDYKLSPLATYYAPEEGSLDELRGYIRGLPMDEDPQVFGLHSNALITAQTQACTKFLDTIVSVQPRLSSIAGGQRPEEVATEMAEVFLARVPAKLDRKVAHKETYKRTPEGGVTSLGVFHSQEQDKFNCLIDRVQGTLITLGKAVKGLVVMSAEFEEMYNAFLLQRVPPAWGEPIAYPCLKPLNSWFKGFEARVAFMEGWLVRGPPQSFWVPCFYFPQGLMTCAKQVHARKIKIPIDGLVFFSEPTSCKDPPIAPLQDGCVNIHGLFLQGAGWSLVQRRMEESEKSVLFVELPVMKLRVIQHAEFETLNSEPGRYRCPLYRTSLRKGTLPTNSHFTNFIVWLQIPSAEHDEGHWIRRGVAMLCMLDD